MENSTGSITPFVTGVLPKEKYSDVNEFARDLASVLRIDEDRIVVDLVALEDLKGETGDEGPRGLQGEKGAKGDPGSAGPAGVTGLSPFVTLTIVGVACTWALDGNMPHQSAFLQLIEGTGSILLTITGATSGMRGTLKLKQNGACNGVLGLPANSYQEGGGFLISHADPVGPPIVPVPVTPFIDLLQWIYDGTNYYWTINRNFVLTSP